MMKHEECLEKSIHYIKAGDHILSTTSQIVNEPKILLAVLENVFLSLTNAIGAILYFERSKKTIPPFHNTFESKFHMFEQKIIGLHNYSVEDAEFIKNIHKLVLFHKNSSVEFSRGTTFVMCSEEYDIKKLDVGLLKNSILLAGKFIQKTQSLI
ncbi:MAG: hypothetical protein ACMXYA_01255 [Candidatus Woesearchaeota archaeon]